VLIASQSLFLVLSKWPGPSFPRLKGQDEVPFLRVFRITWQDFVEAVRWCGVAGHQRNSGKNPLYNMNSLLILLTVIFFIQPGHVTATGS
jgi:hypothetical protein